MVVRSSSPRRPCRHHDPVRSRTRSLPRPRRGACCTPAGSLVEGERGVALDRGSDSLPLSVGDRVDLIAVDDYSPDGRLLVTEARVLDIEKDAVTVAVPFEGVAELTATRRWGDVALALLPG